MEKRMYEQGEYKGIKYIDIEYYEEYFKEKYGKSEEYLLYFEEMKTLYALCETAINNDFHFTIGIAGPYDYGIHKSPEDKWVVTDRGERREGCIFGEFYDMYDACLCLINYTYNYDWRSIHGRGKTPEDLDKIIKEFDERLKMDIPYEEIIRDGWLHGYYDEEFYNDLAYMIKKHAGIMVNEDEGINERIAARYKIKDKCFSRGPSFFGSEILFYENIAKKLNINVADISKAWRYYKIDDDTCRNQLMDKIDINKYQDLILNYWLFRIHH